MATSIYPFQSIASMATSVVNHSLFSVKSLANHAAEYDSREFGSGIFHSKVFANILLSILPVVAVLFTLNGKSSKLFAFKTTRLPPGPKGWPLVGNIPWFFKARKNPSTFAQFVSPTRISHYHS